MNYKVEFFDKLSDAERFGKDTIRSRFVIGVYGKEKKGTKKQFQEWLDDAIAREVMSEYRAEKMNSCVVWRWNL